MSMPKILLTIVASVSVLMFFQNCQRARLSTKGSADQNSITAIGASSTDLNNMDNNNPPNDVGNPDDDGDDDIAGNPDGDDDHDGDDNDNHHHCSHDPKNREDGDREYVCVIDGPGNSTHIGLTCNKDLEAQHEGPKMLCMTKAACEQQGGRAFAKAHAEKRGFCKNEHNKNVKHISDDSMEELINKYLSENHDGSTGHNYANKN